MRKTDFSRVLVKKEKRFIEVNLSLISFLDTNLRKFQFIRCTWPRKTPTNRILKYFRLDKKLGHEVLYDEIKENELQNKKCFEQLEELYRQLKQKYKEEHNEPEASKWHYNEKEMFRKKNIWRRYLPSLSMIYWVSSGYGERPVRAGLGVLMLFVGLGIFLNWIGIRAMPICNDIELIKGFSGAFDPDRFWLLIRTTIQNVLFFKEIAFKPISIWGEVLVIFISKIIIPLQAALFAFAVRNKFRR